MYITTKKTNKQIKKETNKDPFLIKFFLLSCRFFSLFWKWGGELRYEKYKDIPDIL